MTTQSRGLTRLTAFARGAMLGLAINLSILPMAQAQQASPPRPIGPGEIMPIEKPVVTPIQPETFEAVHRHLSEVLFDRAWNPRFASYWLTRPIDEAGEYDGTNGYGEPYTLSMIVATEATVSELPISAEIAALAAARDLRAALFIGRMSTVRGTVGVHAVGISGLDESGERRHSIVPIGLELLDSPIFLPSGSARVARPPSDEVDRENPPITECDMPAPTACAVCYRDFVCELARAKQAFNEARRQAEQAREQAFESARQTLRNAEQTARDTATAELDFALHLYAGAIAVCLVVGIFGLGIAGVSCFATASVILAVNSRAIADRLSNALNAARRAHQQSVNAANAAYNSAVSNAQDDFEFRVINAEVEFNNCRRDHECDTKTEALPMLLEVSGRD